MERSRRFTAPFRGIQGAPGVRSSGPDQRCAMGGGVGVAGLQAVEGRRRQTVGIRSELGLDDIDQLNPPLVGGSF